MTHDNKKRGPLRRVLGSKGLWISLAIAAVLPLIFLAVEFTRWSRFPQIVARETNLPPSELNREIAQAREALADWLSQNRIAGLSLCVGTAGAIDWCTATGYSDLDEDGHLSRDSSMRLGSVSKPITSILLARLAERGIVDLDQAIGEIRSDLPAHLHPVTLRQLASHTAGIRHYRWRFGWPPHETASRVAYDSVADSLAIFAADPLLFPPGADFTYSSHGYTLIGAVLEQLTGLTFGELLEREISDPLGLETLDLDTPAHKDGWARHFEVKGKWYRKALAVDNSRAWPGAGLRASAPDLVTLVSGLTQENLIGPDSLEMILTPLTLPDGTPNPQNYALGWRLGQTKKFLGGSESYRVAHHGGVSSGSSAFVLYFPDQSLAVAALANSRIGSGPLGDLAFEVAEPFMAKIVAEKVALAASLE